MTQPPLSNSFAQSKLEPLKAEPNWGKNSRLKHFEKSDERSLQSGGQCNRLKQVIEIQFFCYRNIKGNPSFSFSKREFQREYIHFKRK